MFLIRADGNAKIGAGHLMRCMAIAVELAELAGRERLCFVCADGESAELVRENGFQAHVLGTDYRDMESELPRWNEEMGGVWHGGQDGAHVLLVDSYYVTDRYLAELGRFGKVVLMDDMGDRAFLVNCVVNYNAHADPEHYRKLYEGRDVKLLLGSSYAPLRRQFRDAGYRVADRVRNVLLTTGGGDSENIAGSILERIWDENLQFNLVTGRFNPHLERLRGLADRRGGINVYHDVKNMAELMCQCDVAVTAGGSTVYELAALGVPFVSFSCAENQEPLSDYLRGTGLGTVAGAWHRDSQGTLERIGQLLDELRNDKKRREILSQREKTMVDGRGAGRLARALVDMGRTQ